MASIGFISLGCAKNQVDCERMMFRVQEAGYTVKPDIVGSDVVVINTCGFIDSAKAEAIDYILQTAQLKEQGLVGKILVTGCLSQRYQDEIREEMPEVDGVLGTGSYEKIVPAIEDLLKDQNVNTFDSIDSPEIETGRILTTPEHYAYLKIAEGCDHRCAYCIIPYLRGRYRSRKMEDILEEARGLAASGVKELIVVAQDTSRYGMDFPGHKHLLSQLLRELCKIDGIHWVRVHYVYPDDVTDELIETMASEPKIVKYLDIPIQHCNDKILKTMNRRGDRAFVEGVLDKLRKGIPGLVIRTSIITGLPGEGEEEFQELCQFLQQQKMQRVGAFPFSPEEGTPAAKMEYPDTEIAQQRAQRVEEIQSRIMDEINESMIGKTLEVLVDGYDEDYEQFYGRTYGDSPEIDGRVWIASDEAIPVGQFVNVKIDGIVDGDLSGYVVEE